MVNIDELRAELATKHGILVERTDPIFAVVFLNEALLRSFSERVENSARTIEREVAKAYEVTVDTARTSITQACGKVSETLAGVTLDVPAGAKEQAHALIREAFGPYAKEIDARGSTLAGILRQLDDRCEKLAAEKAELTNSRWLTATVIAASTGIFALLMSFFGVWLALKSLH